MKTRTIKALVGASLFIVFLVGIVLNADLKIPLSSFKNQVERALGNLINRQVTIDGKLSVTFSLKPAIEIEGISIANPTGWSESTPMLSVGRGVGKLDGLSLLSGNIRVSNLEMSDVLLNLVMRTDHTANFHFNARNTPDSTVDSSNQRGFFQLLSADAVSLEDIKIAFHDALSGHSYNFEIDEAYGTAREGEALNFSLAGQFAGQSLSVAISGGELAKLVQLDNSWSLRSGNITYADTTVSLTGSVGKETGALAGHLDLSLTGSELGKLGRVFGVSLPDPGKFTLEGRLSITPATITASSIAFSSQPVELRSDLLLSLHGDRPTLMGSVSVDHFDPSLFDLALSAPLREDPEDQEEPVSRLLNLLDQELPLGFLQYLDTDLQVKCSEVQWGTIILKDVQGNLSLVDGHLVVPFHADTMGNMIATQLEIMIDTVAPSFSLEGAISNADFTSLLAAVTWGHGKSAQLDQLDYRIESSGQTLRNLIKNLRTDIQVKDLMAASAGNETLFSAKTFLVTRSLDAIWNISGTGQFLGRPYSTKVVSGKLRDGKDGPVKGIQVNLDACDAELALEFLALDDGRRFPMSVEAKGDNLCNALLPVERFLGGKSSFKVSGKGELGGERWAIDFNPVMFNTFSGSVALSIHSTESGVPFMTVDVHSPILNIDELMSAGETTEGTPAEPADKSQQNPLPGENTIPGNGHIAEKILAVLTREFPSLEFFKVADIDLVVQLGQLVVHNGTVDDVHIDTHLRGGKIVNSPFAAKLNGTAVSGAFELDLMADDPVLMWRFASPHAQLSDIFLSIGLPQPPDIQADNISVSIRLQGNSLLEMVQTSSQEIRIENGLWRIGSPAFNEPIVVTIDRGSYVSQADDPAIISIAGSLSGEPLAMEIRGDGLLARGTERPVELSIDASVGDANLRFAGLIKRHSGGKPTIHLETLVSGSRLDKLNRLLKYDLPPLGPYKLQGALHTAQNLLTLDQLRAEIGSSILTGEATLALRKDKEGKLITPSILNVSLKAPSVQLNDFHITKWASAADDDARKQQRTEERSPPEEGAQGDGYADLLSSDFSNMIEAHLEILVEEVVSGIDRLGSGYLRAHNRAGRNSIELMRIEAPGGHLEMDGYYQEKDGVAAADFHLNMDQFDYGVLVRRIVPESGISGLMNIRIDLSATADDPVLLKEHATGKLRVGIIPKDMEAGAIDLWAVNILSAALVKLMKGGESEINCLAGDFTFDDGMIIPEVFLLDTGRMRVQGKGYVNLQDESIDFHLIPTPKSPQFFSLATPVDVTGSIRDFHIGVSAGNVIGTVFRVISSVVTVPLQTIFTEDMAADGAEACSAAMAWVVEK